MKNKKIAKNIYSSLRVRLYAFIVKFKGPRVIIVDRDFVSKHVCLQFL